MKSTLSTWGAGLALFSARCSFPNYDYHDPTADGGLGGSAAGSAGAQGGTGAGTTVAGASAAANDGGVTGAGGDEAVGGAFECRPDQWPVMRCEGGCLRRFPDHCYDGRKSADEVATDCGGECQRCTNEACNTALDCLSGVCQTNVGDSSCFAPLTIRFTSHEHNPSVGTTAWSITLANENETGAPGYAFKDLKLRYYFARNGVTEPILVRATQSNLRLENGENRELKQTTWTVERTSPRADIVYDAYLEVGFTDSGQLLAGDSIDLYQQMSTGDPGNSSFDQRANYSFTEESDSAWLHLAVFYEGQLVWGLEPRPANPRACFVKGVNLNGPALTISGHPFQAAAQAGVTGGAGVSQSGALLPPVSGALATLLQTATRLQADGQPELEVPIDNDRYLMYLYAVSPTNDGTPSVFTVQGEEPDSSSKFRSQAADGGQAWARLGPFPVNVSDGKIKVAVTTGIMAFTGIELWYPE